MEKRKVLEILMKEKTKKEMIQRYQCELDYLQQRCKFIENSSLLQEEITEYRKKISELNGVGLEFVEMVDKKLPDLEYTVIFRFYVLGDTIENIAERIAYSTRQVSRLKDLAIRHLVERN